VAVPRAVRWLGAAGALGLAVYVVASLTGLASAADAPMQMGLLAVALLISALRARRRDERRVWLALTVGIAVWSSGQLYYVVVEPATFSPADVAYLASYPFFFAALFLLVRARVRNLNREMWIDGLTSAFTIAAVAVSAVHYTAGAAATEGPALVRDLVYVLTDVSLGATAVAVAAACGWVRDRTFIMVGAGFMLLSLTDLLWAIGVAQGTYAFGSPIDPGWTGALLLMAIAGWQPARAVEPLQGAQRLISPVLFATLSVAVLAVDHWIENEVMAHPAAVALSCVALLCVIARLVVTFRQKQRKLVEIGEQATTDALTGLANRRRLKLDLDLAVARGERVRLVIFDLNGFKAYNDSFGHPAGDALLRRLGRRMAEALDGIATSYRLGGDEFCLLADADRGDRPIEVALDALSDAGEGFRVDAAWGAATLGDETPDPVHAMRLADQRMYDGKRSARMSVQHQIREVLLAALRERRPELDDDTVQASGLAREVAARMDMSFEDVQHVAHATELHHIGKLAVPDAVLDELTPPGEADRRYVLQQTAFAERILRAAPAMERVADIVRAAHERYDGTGDPDGLAGEQILLAARIVSVVGAYVAMTGDHPDDPPRPAEVALAELRRRAGTRFDPAVVDVLEEMTRERGLSPAISFASPVEDGEPVARPAAPTAC
jgi:diguanylate cyclase (GGDEF)-like protein